MFCSIRYGMAARCATDVFSGSSQQPWVFSMMASFQFQFTAHVIKILSIWCVSNKLPFSKPEHTNMFLMWTVDSSKLDKLIQHIWLLNYCTRVWSGNLLLKLVVCLQTLLAEVKWLYMRLWTCGNHHHGNRLSFSLSRRREGQGAHH